MSVERLPIPKLALPLLLLWGCESNVPLAHSTLGLDAGASDAGLRTRPIEIGTPVFREPALRHLGPYYKNLLQDPDDLVDLTNAIAGTGEVKYLAQVAGATVHAPLVEPCYFQNMWIFDWHIEFLHAFEATRELTLQEYVELVLRQPTRVWWGGGVKLFDITHPISGEPQVLIYTIYAEGTGGNGLVQEDIIAVDSLMKSCVPYATTILAFLPADPFQEQIARQARADLQTQGVAIVLPEDL